jgi:SOS-response transcriptional repressor LexA
VYHYDFRDMRTRAERVKDNEDFILSFIKEYMDKHKVSPSIKEITEASPLRSLNTVHSYLIKLKEKGEINWEPKTPRTIRIAKKENSAV